MSNAIPLFVLFLLSLTLSGCNKKNDSTNPGNSNSCNLSEPLTDVPWIKQIMANGDCVLYNGATLTSCTYQSQTCIYLENGLTSLGVCLKALYNCKGEKLLDGGSPDAKWQDFQHNATDLKIFWTK